jgi:hypothetical protein
MNIKKKYNNKSIRIVLSNIFSKILYVKNVIFALYIIRNKKNLVRRKTRFEYRSNFFFTIKYKNYKYIYKYFLRTLKLFKKGKRKFDALGKFIVILKQRFKLNYIINSRKIEYFLTENI